MIPLVDLKKQYQPLKKEILARIEAVLDGMQLFLGENVQALEREFADLCGVKYGIGAGEGTTALTLALRACGVGPGDEVITVSHTFIATVEAIALIGARPVFVDIDPVTCTMDVDQIEANVGSRTRAIIPVHLYGQPADMDPILEIARNYGLKVIEDACQAHGAGYKGRPTGSLGDAAAFSFYFSKNLGAYGEGGIVTTNDEDVARRVRMLRDHGSYRRYAHEEIGVNGRLDEIQAAILRVKLPHLKAWNEARRKHAALYNKLLAGTPLVTPTEAPYSHHVYHLYVVRAPWRDELQAYLREQGVATGIHYPIPCHLQRACREFGYRRGELPITERTVGEILSLPMYAELTDEDIKTVANAVRTFYSQHAIATSDEVSSLRRAA
jgi:dTDP-4-amino-4,6-dideoxygalactose transaminase